MWPLHVTNHRQAGLGWAAISKSGRTCSLCPTHIKPIPNLRSPCLRIFGWLSIHSIKSNGTGKGIKIWSRQINLASACNSYSCPMSRGYTCTWTLAVSTLCSLLCQMRFYYVRTSWTGLYLCDSCLSVFLFAGRCEVSGDLSIFFGFLYQLGCHVNRPKTMADRPLGRASASPGSEKSDETQRILKSMQW